MSIEPTTFHQILVKRLGRAKTTRIEDTIRKMLEMSVKIWKNQDNSQAPYVNALSKIINPSVNNADYCNAFGIMQGVAYALSYKSCGPSTSEYPRGWFEDIAKEVGKKAYAAHVAAGTLATVETF